MPHYYLNPVLPPEVIAHSKEILRARTKDNSITKKMLLGLTAEDMQALKTLEEVAQKTVKVSASTVIRRALRMYRAHLLEAGKTDAGLALEMQKLQDITAS